MKNPNNLTPTESPLSGYVYDEKEECFVKAPFIATRSSNLLDTEHSYENDITSGEQKKGRLQVYGRRAIILAALVPSSYFAGHMGVNFIGVSASQVAPQLASAVLPGNIELPKDKNDLNIFDYFGDAVESVKEIVE